MSEIPDQETLDGAAEAGGGDADVHRGRGRPSKRTPEIEAAVFECLELGMTFAETCDHCGVSETQFRSWRQHYPEFADLVRRGEAAAVKMNLAIVRKAAEKNWRAAAWWLERRRPERWGRTERLTLQERRLSERKDAGDRTAFMPDFNTFCKVWLEADRVRAEAEALAKAQAAAAAKPAPGPTADVPEPPAEPEEQAAAPVAEMTPTVVIGGPYHGKPAEYDEADDSTQHGGHRLKRVTFSHEEREYRLTIFACPSMSEERLQAEVVRLLLAGNQAVIEALAGQESPGISV